MNNLLRIISLSILIFGANVLYGQEKLSFAEIDKQTYQSYLDEDWAKIIEIGEKGISQNIDYYYLRMRLGIAYYETKVYEKAIVHFKKALEFNSDDALVYEYLWYSYLYLEDEDSAWKLSENFSPELKQKLNIRDVKFLNSISFDSGYSFNNDFDELKTYESGSIIAHAYEKKLFKSQMHNNLLMSFNFSRRLSLTAAYTNLNIKSYQLSVIDLTDVYEGDYLTKQNQFYAKLNYYNRKKSNLYIAFNYLPNTSSEQVLKIDTSTIPANISVIERDTKTNSFAGTIGIRKTKNLITQNTFLSYSNLNFFKQLQVGYSLLGYFNKKKHAYFSGQLVLWNEPNPNSLRGRRGSAKPISRFMFEPTLGFRISKVWISGFATIGAIKNYVEGDALIVNNNRDVIKFRTGTTIFVPVNKHFDFMLKGLMYNSESDDIITYTLANVGYNTYTYKSFYIIGSLQYKF